MGGGIMLFSSQDNLKREKLPRVGVRGQQSVQGTKSRPSGGGRGGGVCAVCESGKGSVYTWDFWLLLRGAFCPLPQAGISGAWPLRSQSKAPPASLPPQLPTAQP